MAEHALSIELSLYGSDNQPLQAGESIYTPEAVTAHATVSNQSNARASTLDVQWLLDGQAVDGSSSAGLEPNGGPEYFQTTVKPEPGQHEIEIHVDAPSEDDFEPGVAKASLTVLSQDDEPSMHVEEGLPTGRDYAVGVQYAQSMLDWAEYDATDYASKFNEYARYDGNAAGAEVFFETLPEAIDGHWWSVTKDWVKSWIMDLAASNAAGDIAALKDRFFEQFADGMIAGINGESPPGTDDQLLQQVATNVTSEVTSYGPDVVKGLKLYFLKQSSTGLEVDLTSEDTVVPASLWHAGDGFLREGLMTQLHIHH